MKLIRDYSLHPGARQFLIHTGNAGVIEQNKQQLQTLRRSWTGTQLVSQFMQYSNERKY